MLYLKSLINFKYMDISKNKVAKFLLSYYNTCRNSYFLNMVKILQATSKGQITLPKQWRDTFNTKYYKITIKEDELVVQPLMEEETLKNKVEGSWQEYKNGKIIAHEDLMKEYGL